MNVRRYNVLNILATGVVVLVITLAALFWVRWFCASVRGVMVSEAIPAITIQPSRLVPAELSVDPNERFACSAIEARMWTGPAYALNLGPTAYLLARVPGGEGSPVYRWASDPDGTRIYYDRSLGLIVYRDVKTVRQPDGSSDRVEITYYVGPEGMAETPDRELGRFGRRPLAGAQTWRNWLIYDHTSRRFYLVDWQSATIRKGPPLPENDRHRPVQIEYLSKQATCINMRFIDPRIVLETANADQGAGAADASRPEFYHTLSPDSIFVLDACGAIERVDPVTLEYAGAVGCLPCPDTLFSRSGGKERATVDDVFAYRFLPIFMREDTSVAEYQYLGCAVASVSRDTTSMSVGVFDPNGRQIVTGVTYLPEFRGRGGGASSQAGYFRLPGAYPLTVVKFLVESLHPPVLLFASYFTGAEAEATAGWRSLFLLPNSFVAMVARELETRSSLQRFCTALPFLLPSLIGVALLLAVAVTRDCRRLGLSRLEGQLWTMGIFLFGLPAGVTYLLTRPKVTQVTCANCGRPRRPDMDRCHRCKAPWEVPELQPPTWRVLDGGRVESEQPPGPAPEAAAEE